ncbi:MAG TPA: hypothetical protein VIN59_07785 [Alphaproteobacteria bacterium]
MAKKDKYGHRESFPRFYKADHELQQRVGTGQLDPDVITKAQDYMNNVQTDIMPELRKYLDEVTGTLSEARKINYQREEFLPSIVRPLMNIKSVSGMFKELMICRVSAFVLTFLEDVKKFDNDIVDIIEAYTKVVKTLMDLKIKDETNPHGQSFLTEIRNACKRYYDKHAENVGR